MVSKIISKKVSCNIQRIKQSAIILRCGTLCLIFQPQLVSLKCCVISKIVRNIKSGSCAKILVLFMSKKCTVSCKCCYLRRYFNMIPIFDKLIEYHFFWLTFSNIHTHSNLYGFTLVMLINVDLKVPSDLSTSDYNLSGLKAMVLA